VRGLLGTVAEAGLVVAEPVPDVVAFEGLGSLVGTEQPHALGGIAVGLLAAVFPITHVVILSSSPSWVLVRASLFGSAHSRAPNPA
jgi:hypothetical protein